MKKFLFLLFLMIPALVMALDVSCIKCHEDKAEHYAENNCTGCHDGIAGTSRQDLAHYRIIKGAYSYHLWESPQVEKGADIIKKYTCRRCHKIDNNGSSLASNLDMSVGRLTAADIAVAIKTPNDQMPDFSFSQDQIEFLVNALLRFSRINTPENVIEVVHFGGSRDTETFQTKCGGCHMALSSGGALGKRPLAPFISGLNENDYPPVDNRRWSRALLSDWLDNPRKIKPNAVMPVIELSAEEKNIIIDIIWSER